MRKPNASIEECDDLFISLKLKSSKESWRDTQWSRAHSTHLHMCLGAQNSLQLQLLGGLTLSSSLHGHWHTYNVDSHTEISNTHKQKIKNNVYFFLKKE